jgi:hypothetical protein
MAQQKTAALQLAEHPGAACYQQRPASDGASMPPTDQGHDSDLASEFYTDDTDEFAAFNLVKPQTVRKRYAATGSYFGVRCLKLASGRLKWPHVLVRKHHGAVA